MATRETDLPGVGPQFSIDLEGGDELVIVEHRAGRWEIALVDTEGKTTPALQLQPKEAAELGRILSRGEVVQEDPRKRMLFEQVGLEWAQLDESSPLVGQTLQSSGIRARTGANVIAVLRGDESIPSPPPDTAIRAGDTLVLIGHPDQIERFLTTFTNLSQPT